DPESEAVTVVVFAGETPAEAASRHRELRPDHAGRLVRFTYRNVPRHPVEEMFAVHTSAEIRAVMDHIEEADRGLTVGERMLPMRTDGTPANGLDQLKGAARR